ncbi:hypothetical protein DQX05_27540 [Paenibacillus thiaminolyticus]|uniref:Uncharacterized protein n=1 Tax=Paenibacillus thiaminolyticus TaxID=49283 RepID=A0A3A3GC28_PANTH|nr:hypothetical protein DQX05_27540 [Paenibacillus thiaminolyticus]
MVSQITINGVTVEVDSFVASKEKNEYTNRELTKIEVKFYSNTDRDNIQLRVEMTQQVHLPKYKALTCIILGRFSDHPTLRCL